MILNNKILKAMETNKATNIERFDKMGLDMLHDSVRTEELTLLEFTTLADIYKVPYTFIVDTGVYLYVYDDSSIIWNDLSELYHKLTFRKLSTARLTFTELQAKFNEIGATVKVE